MATAYHVNGPAIVSIGGQGTSGSLQVLGYTEDGADIEINNEFEPIMGDVGGPSKPQDLQDMGDDATIRLRLLSYDINVLNQIRTNWIGEGSLEGTRGPAGFLMGSNNAAFRVVIASATDEPWRFFSCIARGLQGTKIGVRKTVWNLNLYAWAFIPATATSASGIALYDHTAA